MSSVEPGSESGPGAVQESFADVGAVGALREGGCLTAVLAGRSVVVFRSGGRYHAFSDRCPHNGLPLRDGCLKNGIITCRHHGWQFDVTTGSTPGSAPAEQERGPRLRIYPTRVEAGRLLVRLTPCNSPDESPAVDRLQADGL